MQLVARSDMDEQIAYNVTKAIVENVEKYKAAHPLLQKAVTEQTLAEGGLVPFHPGRREVSEGKRTPEVIPALRTG
jgi:uncharacterized protein